MNAWHQAVAAEVVENKLSTKERKRGTKRGSGLSPLSGLCRRRKGRTATAAVGGRCVCGVG